MHWIAWRMLVGHRTKYLAMLFGVTFAALLIAQQMAIFCGVLRMTTGQIRDIEEAPIWVLTPQVRYIDDLEPLSERQLDQVRSVPGVAWAVRLEKGFSRAQLADGHFQQVILLGLDDATLVGAPRTMLVGSVSDLQKPDAVILDEVGHQLLWPDQPWQVGRTLTINHHRAVVVGICRASLTFQTLPLVYTRVSQAAHYLPPQRKTVSAILVQGRPSAPVPELCRRIQEQTGLLALTREEFAGRTIDHYLKRTGLLINFGTTVLLGFLVGIAISGQTFYTFTVENLPQFAMLKAMGTVNRRLVWMVLQQSALVGSIGYGLGVGLAAIFGELTRGHSKLVFYMPWQVLVGTGVAIVLVTMLTSLLSILRVLHVEPARVLR
ncbi:MAG TPA: ABC transporter permease [Gemmataceae bacterium]